MTDSKVQTPLLIPSGTPLIPGKMYVRLYHGRTDPAQEMDGWGFVGPTFGPLSCYVHTYCSTFRIHGECDTTEVWLEKHDDMIQWGGCFYGDMEVFIAGDNDRKGSMNVRQLTDEALDVFWQVIVKHFPQSITGDLSPLATFHLHRAAEEAVEEWITYNAMTQESDIAVGYRFRLFRQVDRFPDFSAPADLTGVVTAVDDSGVWGRMDQQIAGAEQWDNQIHWQTPEEFARDTVPS